MFITSTGACAPLIGCHPAEEEGTTTGLCLSAVDGCVISRGSMELGPADCENVL